MTRILRCLILLLLIILSMNTIMGQSITMSRDDVMSMNTITNPRTGMNEGIIGCHGGVDAQ